MKQKIICLFLCVVLLSSVLVVPSFAEGANTAPLTFADATPVAGAANTYDLPFSITLVDARGVDLNIRLNPHLVETAVLVDPAAILQDAMTSSNQSGDKFKIAIASSTPLSHEGRLFTIRVTLKATAEPTDELCRLLQVKVNEVITQQATDRILITGVTDGSTYRDNVTVAFNEGTATLNGAPFTSGSTVTRAGSYTLVVTDSGGKSRTVQFVIDRTVISVNLEWTDMAFTFDEGEWNVNSHAFDGRGWQTAENGGQITVTNNSNVDVRADYTYAANAGFERIGMQFLHGEESISTQNISINETVTVLVRPTGEPIEQFDGMDIGTITITITKNGEVAENE